MFVERLKDIANLLRLGIGKVLLGLAEAFRQFADFVRPQTRSKQDSAEEQTTGYYFPELLNAAPVSTPDKVQSPSGDAPLPPGKRLYAIGDIHGRADLLVSLLDQIEADCESYEQDTAIIFLGDYIDRGFQSRQVIDIILSSRLSNFDVYCLKGNHEEAMLNFMTNPEFGPKWAAYGGRETLVSYGVRPPRNQNNLEEWQQAHGSLLEVLPMEHENFLMQLLPSLRIGEYGFVHAGLKPGVPFELQSERDLLWIRDEFLNDGGKLDVIAVHGHTPIDQPFFDGRRINVDTGAYISGRLTAVRLEDDTVAFLSTTF